MRTWINHFQWKLQLNSLSLRNSWQNFLYETKLIPKTILYNFIAKCHCNCMRNGLRCQAHSLHIHANQKTKLNYNSKLWGKKSLVNNYMKNWTDIKAAYIILPLYKVCFLKITVLIKAIIKKLSTTIVCIEHPILVSKDRIPSPEEWQGSFLRTEKCAELYLSSTFSGFFKLFF